MAKYSGPRNIAAVLALFLSSVTLQSGGAGDHARLHCLTRDQSTGIYADKGLGGGSAHSAIHVSGQTSSNDGAHPGDGNCLAGGVPRAYFHADNVSPASQQGGLIQPVQRPQPSLPARYSQRARGTRVMPGNAQRMKLHAAFVPARGGSRNAFPYGQCTWWAAQRYFQLHHVYVPWMTGSDAWAWTMRAHQFHWHVSRFPSIGAIVDLQPGVEGAYGLGHVAVVEQVLGNGHVLASTMNWGSQPRKVQYVQYTVGPGVTFITQ